MANTTRDQDEQFAKLIIPSPEGLLDELINWISKNLNPDDVFPTKDLENWAEGEGYKKEE
jgi:hypothetical protein